MKIISTADYAEMSRIAADILSEQLKTKPDSVLGLATGSTPVGMYRELVSRCKKGEISFRKVTSVNLDEYVGLSPQHDQSYRYFMQKNLFEHIDIAPSHTHVPNGTTDFEEECKRYNALINELGVDLQVLGLGHNGHIGFNEPGEEFVPDVHAVDLTESTILANARFFASIEEVPRRAITMGIGNIMNAKKIILLVSGAEKAEIVKTAFTGTVTPRVPASILQTHPDFTIIGDAAALSKL